MKFELRKWQSQALKAWELNKLHSVVIRAVTGAGKSIVIAEVLKQESEKVVVCTPSIALVEQLAETFSSVGLEVGKYYTGSKDISQRIIVVCNDSLSELSKKISPPELCIFDECHTTETDQILDVVLGNENKDIEKWWPNKILGFTATPYRSDKKEILSLFEDIIYNYGPQKGIVDGVIVRPKIMRNLESGLSINEACISMIKKMNGPGICDASNISDAMEFAGILKEEGYKVGVVHSRQKDGTRDSKIKELESGKIDIIVHVSMLVTGVDIPCLRWVMMRRKRGSRVSFAQYIGRGLRKHGELTWKGKLLPKKKFCWILDPNDLFNKLSLDYSATLNEGGDERALEMEALALDWVVEDIKDEGSIGDLETLSGVPAKVVSSAVSFVRDLKVEYQLAGHIAMESEEYSWRSSDVTNLQLMKINNLKSSPYPDIPKLYRRALAISIAAAPGFDKGTASDLIKLLLSISSSGWIDMEN